MAWSRFGGTIVGDIVKVDSVLTKELYLQILENCSRIPILGQHVVFQQDDDRRRASKLCNKYLQQL